MPEFRLVSDFTPTGDQPGAIDTLKRHGTPEEDITIVRLPGAFEMPLVLDKIAQKGEYDAIVALGAVIRGGTPHFEYVAGECVKGMAQVTLRHGIPIAFGVLTVDTIEQAIERAGLEPSDIDALVLATTTPYDLVKPFADRLGLDDVVATRYGVAADGTYDGTLDGPFVWSAGKLEAVRAYAREHGIDLEQSEVRVPFDL